MKRARFRDLPLFWKVLVPFMTLMLIVGLLGAFVIVRDLAQRAQTQLDAGLAQQSTDARATAHERELYLLESANFAANLQGMTESLKALDSAAVTRLLQSVVILKPDLDLVVATNGTGVGVSEFVRTAGAGPAPQAGAGTQWDTSSFIHDALASTTGDKTSGFVHLGTTTLLAVAAPVCTGTDPCAPDGVAIAGIRMATIAAAARSRQGGVGIYGLDGTKLAASGAAPSRSHVRPSASLVRQRIRLGHRDIETLAAPLRVQSRAIGTITVTTPARPAFAAVRNAGRRLALVLLAAMIGIVAIGALLSRFILSQVRPLVATNRALASGDLAARVPVLGSDELGELAQGFNEMATQLQANVETLELRVEERTDEIRRLLRERTEFFAGLSHELRTPLAIIRNEAGALADEAGNNYAPAGAMIADSADQLLNLVNDILNLARAEASSVDIELADVALTDELQTMRPTLEGLARGGGLKFTTKMPADLPAVRVDRNRLREIVVNLVDNAVKYTPEGGRVELGAVAVNSHVELFVRDTGVGIPDDARERLFEPFYRVKGTMPQRGQASSGLGLSLTRRLVEAQGGTIDYTSKPGKGTTFTVHLVRADGA